jgi:Protein of unknown function (DUF3311)
MKRTITFALTLLVVTVYVLHQDFWNWTQVEPIVFGFLPIGLAYQAGFSILAACMMAVLVRFAWPKHLEDVEPPRPGDSAHSPKGHE